VYKFNSKDTFFQLAIRKLYFIYEQEKIKKKKKTQYFHKADTKMVNKILFSICICHRKFSQMGNFITTAILLLFKI
jgi:hypothetical protein